MIRILLIGPLPPPMGGDTRHFRMLCDDLGASGKFSVRLVNTSRGDAHSSLLHNVVVAFKTAWAMLFSLGNVDVVSFHASDRGMLFFGPLVTTLCSMGGKPIIYRLFGGSFGDYYGGRCALGKWLIRKFILSADVVLLQTKRMITQLEDKSAGRLEWFSTYIKAPTPAPGRGAGGGTCSRFVYLGHLWKNKGIETILEVAARLPDGCGIDLYGPLDEYTEDELRSRGRGRVVYRGFLTNEEVNAVLWKYDCLVLPTYHPGEGYPGVIAEAFAHGLPVITTNWLAIPEIADETCAILIEPGNTVAFAEAIRVLHADHDRWILLKEGARERARRFDHVVWSGKFEQICERLVGRQIPGGA